MRDWLKREGEGATADELCRRFEDVFARLWSRSHRTLGDVTLNAILDRVLHNASERYAVLRTIELDASGPRLQGLHEQCGGMRPEDLAPALSFVLLELVTVLDTLTGGVLTPALQAELAASGSTPPNPANRRTGEGSNS